MQEQKDLKSKEELELKRDLYLKKKLQAEQEPPQAGAETLQFEVKLETGDFWRFSLHHSMSGMTGIFNILFTAVAVFLLITRWSVLSSGQRLLLVICALIFTVLQPLLLLRKAHAQAKQPVMKTPMLLTFSEEGLCVEQNDQQVQFTWDQMARMERVSSMIILYMDRVHAYLLPKRIMGEREETLCRMARTHLQPDQCKNI